RDAAAPLGGVGGGDGGADGVLASAGAVFPSDPAVVIARAVVRGTLAGKSPEPAHWRDRVCRGPAAGVRPEPAPGFRLRLRAALAGDYRDRSARPHHPLPR